METVNNNGKGKTAITIVAILATFLLMAFLVRQMVKVTQPAPIAASVGAARAEENAKIRAAGAEAAKNWGYSDQARGMVRLPVEDAMKLTVQGYQNAAAFKTDLVARVEKASAPPPKPKNEYE
jgi:hypothetical protein